MDKQMFLNQIEKLKKLQWIIGLALTALIVTSLVIGVNQTNKDDVTKVISLSLVLWVPLAVVFGGFIIVGSMMAKTEDQRLMALTIFGSLGFIGLSVIAMMMLLIPGIVGIVLSAGSLVVAIAIIAKGWAVETKFGGRAMY